MTLKYQGVEIEKISIFRHPLMYITLLFKLFIDLLIWIKNFIIRKFLLIVILGGTWALLNYIPELHVKNRNKAACQIFCHICSLLDYLRSRFFNWLGYRSSYFCSLPGSPHCQSGYGCYKLRSFARHGSFKMGF